MGRMERKLDLDLIAKLKAGIKPKNEPEGIKHQKPLRAAATYRGARRNAVLRGETRGVWKTDRSIEVRVRHADPETYYIERFGKTETRPLTYKPGGARERGRLEHQRLKLQQATLQAAE